jgi:hypothetical protein
MILTRETLMWKEIHIVCRESFNNPQRTECVSIMKTCQLLLLSGNSCFFLESYKTSKLNVLEE